MVRNVRKVSNISLYNDNTYSIQYINKQESKQQTLQSIKRNVLCSSTLGVHLIVTTALPPEVLRLTPIQKERLRSNEILIELQDSGTDFHETENVFDTLEKLIGENAANRIGAILASTEYGLSETEILEVIMPTGGDGPLFLNEGLFNFGSWCLVRRTFNEYLKVSFV